MTLDTSKTEWDLSPLASGDEDPAFEEKRKKVEEANLAFAKKWSSRRDWLEDAVVLREALDEYEHLATDIGTSGDEGFYFSLRGEQDKESAVVKAKQNKIDDFATKLGNELQFFDLRLAKVSAEKQKEFLEHRGLEKYRHFLERLFASAKYQLSESEERVMSLKSGPAQAHWIRMMESLHAKETREVAVKGKKEEKTFADLQGMMQSSEKEVRDVAAEAFDNILEQYVDVAEAEFNAVLDDKRINDELRGLERPDAGRHLADDVDAQTVDTVVDAVRERFDLSKRFYTLKAKVMGLKKLQYYERAAASTSVEGAYSYEDSVKLVHQVFQNLDSEFADIFEAFLREGRIDVFPRKGKNTGAFCTHALLRHPVYVLLTHTDTLRDVKTLAHELGHGIHNELMKKQVHGLDYGMPKSTAEVASTFMEDFVLARLKEGADDEKRFALVMQQLDDQVATIFRQIAFYRFEWDVHQKFREQGYLSKDELGALFKEHMTAYMGEAVDVSEAGAWWSYVPHFRMFFYVYSYAMGLLISKSLQGKVRADPSFIKQVKEFLSAGESASPKELFLRMGIDITRREFWEEGLDEVEGLLEEAEGLARKLGKI